MREEIATRQGDAQVTLLTDGLAPTLGCECHHGAERCQDSTGQHNVERGGACRPLSRFGSTPMSRRSKSRQRRLGCSSSFSRSGSSRSGAPRRRPPYISSGGGSMSVVKDQVWRTGSDRSTEKLTWNSDVGGSRAATPGGFPPGVQNNVRRKSAASGQRFSLRNGKHCVYLMRRNRERKLAKLSIPPHVDPPMPALEQE